MDLGLQGRRAVVTGAGAGIGLAVTSVLAAEGATVVAATRSTSPALAKLATTGRVHVVEADLAEPGVPEEVVAAAGDSLDILVNNVGLSVQRTEGFVSTTDEQWTDTLRLNLLAAVSATRAALPVMLSRRTGSIVNVASVNAWLPDPVIIDYSAAKAALWNFGKALSNEVGPHGIRVNTVAPGPTATRRWTPELAPKVAARMVTGRLTQADEIAVMVAFLASARSSNITGATVTVDGGLTPTT